MASDYPEKVLSEALADVIAGRHVKVAVFSTFSFDPGFFELHILPALFDHPFSQVDKVKQIQLDDQLRTVRDVAVYYDLAAISQNAMPAQLDFRRIGVRVPNGVFHPKLVLVLVENTEIDAETDENIVVSDSLIVGALSANLTRAGWWENVETGHFETLEDKDVTNEVYPFRKDLLKLVNYLLNLGKGEEQFALSHIKQFIVQRTPTKQRLNNSADGQHYTRLFIGQTNFSAWLKELRLGFGDWNLEIVSPYFDGGHATVLEQLLECLGPTKTRVFLPTNPDGSALVSKSLYEAVESLGDVEWANVPSALTKPGNRSTKAEALPRFVHAKIYRLWRRSDGKQVVITGSLNLTSPAHSKLGAGNLEASFLVDISECSIPKRWWLQAIEIEPNTFAETDSDIDSECDNVFLHLSLRFDWSDRTVFYFLDARRPESFSVLEGNGIELFCLEMPICGKWTKLPKGIAESVEQLLSSTSFVTIKHAKGQWRVLIREEGVSHRPSLLSKLTPEEILYYWSLLSDVQKEAFVTEKLAAEGHADLQGLSTKTNRYESANTVFDRFSGIYHAFERLVQHVADCIEREEFKEAEARLLGAKYDSLPELLSKTLDQKADPVMRYIVFLCAKQAVNRIKKEFREFWQQNRKQRKNLERLLGRLDELKEQLPIENEHRQEFLDWYESMFLKMIPQPEEVH